MKRSFTDEQIAEMVRRYENGESGCRIAKDHNCDPTQIYKWLHRAGADVAKQGGRPREFTPDERKEILDRYDRGDARNAIARSLRADADTIDRVIEEGRGSVDRTPRLSHKGQHGEKNPNWTGGRRVDKRHGYMDVWVPKGHWARTARGSYAREHRVVMGEYLGRPLERLEHVHHINGDRLDNRIENLQLVRKHGAGCSARCRACGSTDIEFTRLGDGDENDH